MASRCPQMLLAIAALAAGPFAAAQFDNLPGTFPFESLVVKGSLETPENKSSPGSLETRVEFVPAEFSDGIYPSTDEILFVFEPAQPANLPAVLPAIVVALPGGCLVPHKKGGWVMGDGSVRDCDFELYRLFPDQTTEDLTYAVINLEATIVTSVQLKGWQMKLQIDFLGLDPVGITIPSRVFVAVGKDAGGTKTKTKNEFFGVLMSSN